MGFSILTEADSRARHLNTENAAFTLDYGPITQQALTSGFRLNRGGSPQRETKRGAGFCRFQQLGFGAGQSMRKRLLHMWIATRGG
jgi:hypothetical protein